MKLQWIAVAWIPWIRRFCGCALIAQTFLSDVSDLNVHPYEIGPDFYSYYDYHHVFCAMSYYAGLCDRGHLNVTVSALEQIFVACGPICKLPL